MSGFRHLLRMASDRMRGVAVCVALSTCLFGYFDPALAQVSSGQAPVGSGGPSQPPLDPPVERSLASGDGMLTMGDWILSPTLDLYTLYDSNIQSSSTTKFASSGFHYHPALQAELDTGFFDTRLYGNFDSTLYPSWNALNTFNRQAGVYETYAPLRDLTFTTQLDYTHNTSASVVVNSIPAPITSAATPAPQGAEGVVATQQTTINPNDTYTATINAYKEFNRAFLRVGSSLIDTQYEMSPTQDFYKEGYNGGGGFWFSPILYAYADANDVNIIPAIGPVSNSYIARTGIGSAQIGLFQGSIYYGQQGTAVDQGGGTAGGDVYGGLLSFYPTSVWTMSVSVDRVRNRSDITANVQGLSGLGGVGGLALSAASVSSNSSTQITTIAYRTNYTLSDQASVYGVVSDTRISYLDMPRVDNSWLASAGVRYQLKSDLSLTADYQYTRYISDQPLTSFNKNLVSLGAHYKF
jgi:hypothetical protein